MVTQPSNQEKIAIFEQLWGITNELRQKLVDRFPLNRDASTNSLESFSSSDGDIKGSLQAFSGGEVDWLVHSHLNNLQKSNFSTMRLTAWLKPQIKVPHLAFELSTFANIFFYMDYIPRSDLLTDLGSLSLYYEPVNQTFLNLQADSRLSRFTSKNLYIRSFQSPINLCYTCSPTEDVLELIRTMAHEMLDRWLKWIDEADRISENEWDTLAQRDLAIRRTSAQTDPGNQIAVQMLGQELTDKLVRSLWGGDRIS